MFIDEVLQSVLAFGEHQIKAQIGPNYLIYDTLGDIMCLISLLTQIKMRELNSFGCIDKINETIFNIPETALIFNVKFY